MSEQTVTTEQQHVEKVTAPTVPAKTEEHPVTAQSPTAKNPKRQAAGRASAESRKKKKQQLIDELIRTKDTLRKQTESTAQSTAQSTIVYIAGAISLVGLIYYVLFTKKTKDSVDPVRQLDIRNPIDME